MPIIIPKTGLSYRKLDLHIHTPASYDYNNETATAKDIVEKAISKGLDAIAITDHNTGAFIDKVKAAVAEVTNKKITVFPGVEITCAGGKDGSIHIVALFDPSKSSQDIILLLGALQIKSGSKPEEIYSPKSPIEVIDIIHQFGGLPICAHANSSNGIFSLRGNPRTDVIQNPNLLAVEATDFDDDKKKETGKRVCDYLNGNDPIYHRKLAVFQSSDSHELEKIGSRYSLFKLEEISLDGLRQCFYDPDVRIRLPNEYEERNYPKITYLSVNQGFLEDQKISFHHGLNCIVGGKGVGKSLIIEAIRFALDQCSKEKSIMEDHNGKIKNKIGNFGEVNLEFEIEKGQKYKVVKKYNGEDNPLRCVNVTSGELFDGKIPRIFPILAYSQNEILKTAENEYAQLQLIDNFHDPSVFHSQIHSIEEALKKVDSDFSETIYAISDLDELNRELQTLKEQQRINSLSLENELFSEMEILEGKELVFKNQLKYLESSKQMIIEALNIFEQNCKEPIIDKKYTEDPLIVKSRNILQEVRNKIDLSLKMDTETVDYSYSELKKIIDSWHPELEQKRDEYEKMLSETGGNKKDLELRRRDLAQQINEKQSDVLKLKQKVENYTPLGIKRNELLDNLDKVYYEFYEARKEIFERLTQQSQGRLKLEITKETNSKKYYDKMSNLLKGQRIQKAVIEKITNNISPREFVELVIADKREHVSNEAGISAQNAEKIVSHLKSLENFEEFLSICYLAYREDTPSILYKKDDGQYYPLDELSIGQKCTALLIVALSDGDKPIIIDQPEDSLDNPSVFEDIVSKLRSGKENRQFILTTHNSNVGVASDSDNFIILGGTASSCKILHCGAIDRKVVRSDIINHLEGGDEPYHLKSLKYNMG